MRGEKNLLQPGCKPGRLQPLTKMRIDPTCRLIIQQKRYLVDLQMGSILIFVRGCKRPGLQPRCNKFFSLRGQGNQSMHPLPAGRAEVGQAPPMCAHVVVCNARPHHPPLRLLLSCPLSLSRRLDDPIRTYVDHHYYHRRSHRHRHSRVLSLSQIRCPYYTCMRVSSPSPPMART
jgi:hypothetical protein